MHTRINYNHSFTFDHFAAGYVSVGPIENRSLSTVVLALPDPGVALTSGRDIPLTVSQILEPRCSLGIGGDEDSWRLRTHRSGNRRERTENGQTH